MADQLGYVTGGTVAVRAGQTDQDGRTIEGYAYRWGDLTPTGGTPEYPGLAEGFERGAFAPALAERSERPYPSRRTTSDSATRGGYWIPSLRVSTRRRSPPAMTGCPWSLSCPV